MKMRKIIKLLFFILAVLFINVSSTRSFYVSKGEINNNTFSTGNWSSNDPKITINEIYPNPAADDPEQIELYNGSNQNIDLSNWTIEDGIHSPKSLSGKTIIANGFLILVKGSGADFTFGLNNDGDILILKQEGEVKDQVSWGDWGDGNLADNAPNPLKGKSIGRYPDGSDTDFDLLDLREMNLSMGIANIYP